MCGSVFVGQLEFVQILVIVVVMMVMVVVITCLLNHYRLSAYSLLTRHGTARRQHLPFTSVSKQTHTPTPIYTHTHTHRHAHTKQTFTHTHTHTHCALFTSS